ncbi:MarR family transcriptional regulator [Kitasatospora sp. RB6PN24]|uniref:MarR family winged helix-turn-helix transcriptional regulator n=1 Tax=Kitasatospora humi TaxID=2893891 RepID=UPI001E621357|nr:MarR family transcriptional regulator [Kitasatospora humi]MCC9306874.1 MarR family transcriptional regulator [Kitasatospora humi]
MNEDQAAGQERVFRAVEREVAVMFRRGRARSAEMSRLVHPQLEGGVAYSLLAHLYDVGQVRVTDVGCHFGVGKATISRQIKALEELGLVAREPDPQDGRASLVSLTEEGGARYRRAHEARLASFREMLAGWEPVDLSRFAELLARFNESVAAAPRLADPFD